MRPAVHAVEAFDAIEYYSRVSSVKFVSVPKIVLSVISSAGTSVPTVLHDDAGFLVMYLGIGSDILMTGSYGTTMVCTGLQASRERASSPGSGELVPERACRMVPRLQ